MKNDTHNYEDSSILILDHYRVNCNQITWVIKFSFRLYFNYTDYNCPP